MDGLREKVSGVFRREFGHDPVVSRSPGRINLIGEHTDYNDGFVLPGSIDKAAYAATGKRDDGIIRLISTAFSEAYEFQANNIKPSGKGWPDYILGVANQLQKAGKELPGFNMVIDGDVPIGSGMSSSAAFECAALFGLDHLFSFSLDKLEMARMAQKGEQVFAGVMVGIMDQFASIFGKKDHVIELDCHSMEYRYRPFRFEEISIILLNTNVHHSLASSEYNQRREQCRKGVDLVSKFIPVSSLREVTIEMLNQYVLPVDKQTYRRCRYVIEENERVKVTCEALERNDIKKAGNQLFLSHQGLSDEYNVSCEELDFLVGKAKEIPEVTGARMMGGGFGGCTINLVKSGGKEKLLEHVSEPYAEKFGKEISVYEVSLEDGASIIQ